MADVDMQMDKCGQEVTIASVDCECVQSVLERVDGSASFKQGSTEVLAAVYGPAEVRMNKEMIDRVTVDCNYRVKSGVPGTAEKLVERLIRNSCDSIILSSYNPRAAISIIVQIINDAGKLLSCALNAAFMALVNAGIPLRCMAAAVSCFISKDGEINLTATKDEDQESAASFTFVFESTKNDVITSFSKGKFTIEQYFTCLTTSKEAAKAIFSFQRNAFQRSLSLEKKDEN